MSAKIQLPEEILAKFREAGRKGGLATKQKAVASGDKNFYRRIGTLGARRKSAIPSITDITDI
jgi:hypothetical protein